MNCPLLVLLGVYECNAYNVITLFGNVKMIKMTEGGMEIFKSRISWKKQIRKNIWGIFYY